jgi:MFS family permease
VSTVVAVVSGPAFGWLSDRVSHRLVLSIRGAANALASVLYLAWPSLGGVAAARCVDDVGKAAFRPAWGALMTEVSRLDRSRRARTMSWLGMGEDAGGVLGPMLAAAVWSSCGIGALMGVRVLLAAASEVYALRVVRRFARRPRRCAAGAVPG